MKRTILKHLRRRHNLKGTEINIKDYYNRLDPRECNLNLDEQAMTSIFGAPKKVTNEVVIANFVTVTENIKLDQKSTEEEKNDVNNEVEQKEVKSEESENVEILIPENSIKREQDSDHAEEDFEPTDFVSVKIEPMDDDCEEFII